MNTLNNKRFGFLLVLLMLLSGFVLVGCTSRGTESESADPNVVTDIVWEWESVSDQQTQETTDVPDPENYTLIMREDGTFSGTADCNQISGTYTTENGYFFTLGPSTMAACAPDSLDQQYLDLLGRVVAGGPNGSGGFALETAAGGDRLEYRNGGAAPAQ